MSVTPTIILAIVLGLLGIVLYFLKPKVKKASAASNAAGQPAPATTTTSSTRRKGIPWWGWIIIVAISISALRSCFGYKPVIYDWSVPATSNKTVPDVQQPTYITSPVALQLGEWSGTVKIAPGSTFTVSLRANRNEYGHPELRKADGTTISTPTQWWSQPDENQPSLVLTNKGSETLEGRFIMVKN
jgi:hypothetical protein